MKGASWGPFNEATKLKYSPRPCSDVKRIDCANKKETATTAVSCKSIYAIYAAASGFGWCFFFSPQLRKTTQSGLAMKMDE